MKRDTVLSLGWRYGRNGSGANLVNSWRSDHQKTKVSVFPAKAEVLFNSAAGQPRNISKLEQLKPSGSKPNSSTGRPNVDCLFQEVPLSTASSSP
jgi:hypothetical protein